LSVTHELTEILSRWKKNEALTLASSTTLEELNIDSLDLVEVMFEIEEKFDVNLTQSHQEARTATLADVAGWIEQELTRAAAKPTVPGRRKSEPVGREVLEEAPLP